MKPVTSIVVLACSQDKTIQKALDSCSIDQNKQREIIIVLLPSKDTTANICRNFASNHAANCTLIQLAERTSPGLARNMGMAESEGTWIVFLDGDDWFEPGALSAIETTLADEDPDVLVYNHQRVWNSGRVMANPRAGDLNPDEDTEKLRGKLLFQMPVAWNKAVRRDYLQACGLQFPAGIYEDIPWHMELIIHAAKIAVLPTVCVSYRQHDSILRTVSGDHFDSIIQWQRVFELLAHDAVTEARYGRAIHQLAHAHLWNILYTWKRIPTKLARTFRAQASSLLLSHGQRPAIRQAYVLAPLGLPRRIARRICKKATNYFFRNSSLLAIL